MLVGAGGVGMIAGSLETLVDEAVGVISRIGPVANEPGAPAFFHVEARICDTSAFGGPAARTVAGAASLDRAGALEAAAARAVAAYAAALFERDALPLASYTEAGFPRARPSAFALFSKAQYDRSGFPYVPVSDATPLRWASAIDLATGEEVHIPAAFVFYPFPYWRRGGDLPIAPPGPAGIACAEGIAGAALAGLYDVVGQDSAALFWQARTAPPPVRIATLPDPIRDIVRRFENGGDRLVVLDVTSNNTVPAFVAMLASDRPERPAFVVDVAADLDPGTAIARALVRLAETHRRSRDAMRLLVRVTERDEWEDMFDPVDHLLFAADHANRRYFEFAFATDLDRDFRDYEPRRPESFEADLDSAVRLVNSTGHRAYAANLTTEDVGLFGLNVCRVVVPGYLPLTAGYRYRSLGGDRLYEAPRRLGYRGIKPGEPDNPAPHPFFV